MASRKLYINGVMHSKSLTSLFELRRESNLDSGKDHSVYFPENL